MHPVDLPDPAELERGLSSEDSGAITRWRRLIAEAQARPDEGIIDIDRARQFIRLTRRAALETIKGIELDIREIVDSEVDIWRQYMPEHWPLNEDTCLELIESFGVDDQIATRLSIYRQYFDDVEMQVRRIGGTDDLGTRAPGEKFDLAILGWSAGRAMILGRWAEGLLRIPKTREAMQLVVDADEKLSAVDDIPWHVVGALVGLMVWVACVVLATAIFGGKPFQSSNQHVGFNASIVVLSLFLFCLIGFEGGRQWAKRLPERIRRKFKSNQPSLAALV